MQVIPPVTVTDSTLISSTIYETFTALYSGATTYALNAVVTVPDSGLGTTGAVYKSLQAGNLNKSPDSNPSWWVIVARTVAKTYDSGVTYAADARCLDMTNHMYYISMQSGNLGNDPSASPEWWLEISPSYKWAMFNLTRNNRSSAPLSFTVVFTPGQRVNSLALSGIRANSYVLTVTSVSGGGTIYSSSGALAKREVASWYDYFYEPFSASQNTLAFFDIPPFSDAIFTLTLTASEGDAELAAVVFGTFVYIGAAQYRAISDVLNFSTIARDADGIAVLTQRRNVPKTRQTVLCEKRLVNKILALRTQLNAEPAFWFALNDDSDGYFETVAILGIYKQFGISLDYPEHANIALELEEI